MYSKILKLDLHHDDLISSRKLQNNDIAPDDKNAFDPLMYKSINVLKNLIESTSNIKKADPNRDSFPKLVSKGEFKIGNHFYPNVVNAKIHPTVKEFFKLDNQTILSRYFQSHPDINKENLAEYLAYQTKYFKWAGSDLFKVLDENGSNKMIVLETNSCPSGQKSMPLLDEKEIFGGYRVIIQSIFENLINTDLNRTIGDLAVVFDKNPTENSAYSCVLSEISNEKIWLVDYCNEENEIIKWIDGIMYVRDINDQWHPIRACLRYVTQQPWKKIPLNSKTVIINPIISCLAGGRNKIMASYAYNKFNKKQELENTNLKIRLPYSLININKLDIPYLLKNDFNLNGRAVIKVPYANCGQGVYTILNKHELDMFMNVNHKYDKFIVQSLVGDYVWSNIKNNIIQQSSLDHDDEAVTQNNENQKVNCGDEGEKLKEKEEEKKVSKKREEYYHIGTIPSKIDNNIYVFDLRMIVTSNKNGFIPVSLNARRARKPLDKYMNINKCKSSWDMLGTNLSIKIDKDIWNTESDRLLTMDNNDFNMLGLNIDDLIDAYIQTVLSVIAIDKLCIDLYDKDNNFNYDLFRQLNPDESLLKEIRFN